MKCHSCKGSPCGKGVPCVSKDSDRLYDEVDRRMMETASDVEALYYCELTRLDETMEFCRRMGYRKIGLAFCGGLKEESAKVASIFEREFEVYSACCKVGGHSKEDWGHTVRPWAGSITCNPAEQARSLAEAGTEFNVVVGLCVGHDSVFYRHSQAPVTTLIVKDRRLGHNPVAAVNCPYVFNAQGKRPKERT